MTAAGFSALAATHPRQAAAAAAAPAATRIHPRAEKAGRKRESGRRCRESVQAPDSTRRTPVI